MGESTFIDVAVNIGCAFLGFCANSLRLRIRDVRDSRKIYKWFVKEGKKPRAPTFRSIEAISRGVCMSPGRVGDLCGRSKKIHPSTGKIKGLWTISDLESPPGFFDIDWSH